jgi:hypothetical protein
MFRHQRRNKGRIGEASQSDPYDCQTQARVAALASRQFDGDIMVQFAVAFTDSARLTPGIGWAPYQL